jgi:hypothetical protein
VEELRLGLDLRLEELDVVDEQDVRGPQAPAEPVDRARAPLQRGDELVREALRGGRVDREAAARRQDVVADGVQQVGLADPGRAVDEERVVGLAG